MISKKFILTATLMLSIILTSFSGVYAKSNASGELTLKQTSSIAQGTYKPGEEITISVSISVKGVDGINMFLADIEYDTNLLQYEGVILNSEWSLIADDDQIFIERSDLKDSAGTICKIKFKVTKEFNETTIGLKHIDASSIYSVGLHYLYGNINEPNIIIKAKPAQVVNTTKPQAQEVSKPQETKAENTIVRPQETKIENVITKQQENNIVQNIQESKTEITTINQSQSNIMNKLENMPEDEIESVIYELDNNIDNSTIIANDTVNNIIDDTANNVEENEVIQYPYMATAVQAVVDSIVNIVK